MSYSDRLREKNKIMQTEVSDVIGQKTRLQKAIWKILRAHERPINQEFLDDMDSDDLRGTRPFMLDTPKIKDLRELLHALDN